MHRENLAREAFAGLDICHPSISSSSICSLTSLTKSAALFHSLSYFLSLNSFYNSFWVFGDIKIIDIGGGVLYFFQPSRAKPSFEWNFCHQWYHAGLRQFLSVESWYPSLMPFPNYDWLLDFWGFGVIGSWRLHSSACEISFLAALEDSTQFGWVDLFRGKGWGRTEAHYFRIRQVSSIHSMDCSPACTEFWLQNFPNFV